MLCRLLDAIGSALFRIIRRSGLARGKQAPRGAAPRRILVIQLDHLGDAVISLPMLSRLRERFPMAAIDALCGVWNRELFAATGLVERVHVLRFNRFARDWRRVALFWPLALLLTALKLRKRYDLAIDVRGEFPLAWFMWILAARRRIGWVCGGGGFLLTDSVPYLPGRPEHLSRLALLQAIGIDAGLHDGEGRLPPGAEARAAVRQRLDGLPRRHGPLIVVHVAAGTPAKNWPVASWQRLIGRLTRHHQAIVVLVGAAGDTPRARQVKSGLSRQRVHDWVGQLSLCELVALLEQADLFIGADSGPAHLAAAAGTSTLVLFSGTNRIEQWRPRGTKVVVLSRAVTCAPCARKRCPLADHPCMTGISVEAVSRAAARLLDGDGGRTWQANALASRSQTVPQAALVERP
jgi:heptosyltransferase-2